MNSTSHNISCWSQHWTWTWIIREHLLGKPSKNGLNYRLKIHITYPKMSNREKKTKLILIFIWGSGLTPPSIFWKSLQFRTFGGLLPLINIYVRMCNPTSRNVDIHKVANALYYVPSPKAECDGRKMVSYRIEVHLSVWQMPARFSPYHRAT